MNKIYKVIWSKVRNCYIVVSEIAKSHTCGKSCMVSSVIGIKKSLALAVLLSVLNFGYLIPAFADSYVAGGATAFGSNSVALGTGASVGKYYTINVLGGVNAADGSAIVYTDGSSAAALADDIYYVDATGKILKGENGTTLKNVGNCIIAEGSKEVVNGGQLFEINTKLNALTDKVGTVKDGTYVKENNIVGENINSLDEAVAANSNAIGELGSRVSSGFNILGQKINNIGAHAAALAALNPVADDDSKFSFTAGVGSYHNARAGAIGMFYCPSDRYQFSIGGTTGNGEHMYNMGLVIGLDKNVGGPFANKKAMICEIVNLRDERDAQNKKMKDLIEENKMQSEAIMYQNEKIAELQEGRIEQEEKIEKLMKIVEKLSEGK